VIFDVIFNDTTQEKVTDSVKEELTINPWLGKFFIVTNTITIINVTTERLTNPPDVQVDDVETSSTPLMLDSSSKMLSQGMSKSFASISTANETLVQMSTEDQSISTNVVESMNILSSFKTTPSTYESALIITTFPDDVHMSSTMPHTLSSTRFQEFMISTDISTTIQEQEPMVSSTIPVEMTSSLINDTTEARLQVKILHYFILYILIILFHLQVVTYPD
jgi:hypothetical protein